MDFLQLRYFHEVARLGSIRKASETLNVSPSSISRQIIVLERQFGTALLERSSSGVRLSHAGQFVFDFARATLLSYDTLRSDIDDIRGIRKAIVRVAAIDSVIAWPLFAAIEPFRTSLPAVTFRLHSLTASGVVQAVKGGTCDIGISINVGPDPDLQILAEVEEPLVAAVAPSHPLSSSKSITLSELRSYDLAIHEADHGLRRMIDEASHLRGFDLTPILSSSSFNALREFAMRGLGVAILTRDGVSDQVASGTVRVIPIDEPALSTGRLKLIARRDRRFSRVLRLFVEELAGAIAKGPREMSR
jgi:DNA-binding transcriptional LysR family regulator